MVSISNQSQKADIFLYITNTFIIKLGNEYCLAPGNVKHQLYKALIITNVLVDFIGGKEENFTKLANGA